MLSTAWATSPQLLILAPRYDGCFSRTAVRTLPVGPSSRREAHRLPSLSHGSTISITLRLRCVVYDRLVAHHGPDEQLISEHSAFISIGWPDVLRLSLLPGWKISTLTQQKRRMPVLVPMSRHARGGNVARPSVLLFRTILRIQSLLRCARLSQ